MKLSLEQRDCITDAINGHNLFITGKAGCGKSVVIKGIVESLESRNKTVVVLAPTGAAAANINGQTLHSFFHIPVFEVLPQGKRLPFMRELWKLIDTIIIDEVSMLRPDWLDFIQESMSQSGATGRFKQWIFVGDMKQLPVVVDKIGKQMLLDIKKLNN